MVKLFSTISFFLSNAVYLLILIILLTGGISGFSISFLKNFEIAQISIFAFVLFFLTRFNTLKKNWAEQSWDWLIHQSSPRLALIFLALNSLILFLAHCFRHWSFRTEGYDVSFIHQALFYPWPVTHLQNVWLKADILPSQTALEGHLTFTLLLLSPLTAWIHSDEFIFFLQNLFLYLPWVFALYYGPLKNQKKLWIIFVILVLCHRALRGASVFDFREDALGFAFLWGMILSLIHLKYLSYFIFLVLCLLTKENIFVVTLFFIFPILFLKSVPSKKKIILASFTVLLSLVYGWIAFTKWIPYFTRHSPTAYPLFARYQEFGSTTPEIINTLLTSPSAWWILIKNIFNFSAIKYLALLFGPWIYLYFKAKNYRETLVWLLPTLPVLGMNLAHPYANQRMMIFHYELLALPFLGFALLLSMSKIHSLFPNEIKKPRSIWLWAILIGLSFSDRWPMTHLQKNLPSIQQWQDYRWLKSLKPQTKKQSLWVDIKLSALFNHWQNLSIYDPLSHCDLKTSPHFWIVEQTQDTTECSQKLYQEIQNKKYFKTLSPSGRYALFELKQPN